MPMLAWELLDSADVPGGNEPLRLLRRGAEYSIRVGAKELMGSAVHGSEEALAALALAATRHGRRQNDRSSPTPLNMLAVTGDHECKVQSARCKVQNGHASRLSATIDHRPSTITHDCRSTRFCSGRFLAPPRVPPDDQEKACVLVGGLGMGYTLAAALPLLDDDAQILVAEVVPAVVRWNRTHLSHLAGNPLADPRVRVAEEDVGRIIAESDGAFDVILLDVDNGPRSLTRATNGWLYAPAGLTAVHAALRIGGVLAVWSAGPDLSFTSRLRRTGFEVEETTVRARGKRGGRKHVIWLASRRS
jgi:spermidine synthase